MLFKSCREKAGLTQKEAAAKLDVSIQTISYWESGKKTPTVEKLIKIADLYGVTTDELLGRVPMDVQIKKEPLPPNAEGERELIIDLNAVPDAGAEFQRLVQQILDQELNRRGIE